MSMSVGTVGVNEIRQILSDTDPAKAIGEVIKQLHKDLDEIHDQIETAKQEEKQVLRLVENRIREVVQLLRSGSNLGNVELAADMLNSLRSEDPLLYAQVRPQVEKLLDAAEQLRRLRMKTIGVPSAGPGTIV